MTDDREIAYEREGALTVCPCCGRPSGARGYACAGCWDANIDALVAAEIGHDDRMVRDWFYRRGVELRAQGKMPALASKPEPKPERWSVRGTSSSGSTWYAQRGVSREHAEAWAKEHGSAFSVVRDSQTMQPNTVRGTPSIPTSRSIFDALVLTDPALFDILNRVSEYNESKRPAVLAVMFEKTLPEVRARAERMHDLLTKGTP